MCVVECWTPICGLYLFNPVMHDEKCSLQSTKKKCSGQRQRGNYQELIMSTSFKEYNVFHKFVLVLDKNQWKTYKINKKIEKVLQPTFGCMKQNEVKIHSTTCCMPRTVYNLPPNFWVPICHAKIFSYSSSHSFGLRDKVTAKTKTEPNQRGPTFALNFLYFSLLELVGTRKLDLQLFGACISVSMFCYVTPCHFLLYSPNTIVTLTEEMSHSDTKKLDHFTICNIIV